MDEPTSSVDTRTEIGIMEAMDRLMQNRTTLMIAHRLTTLENCDMLLMIEDGKLANVEQDVSATVRVALALDRIETAIMRNN
jgi:ATP-binding cassette subfamily B protein